MTKFDRSILENLEKLSRIGCKASEEEEILSNLQKVLKYMELLQELDTEEIPPTSHVLGSLMKNLMRSDLEERILPQKDFFQNVPEVLGGMVRVPPIMKPQE